MLIRVDTKQTLITIENFTESFCVIWKKMYGTLPSKKSVAVIFGQWSLETGLGKFCWNYNIGNVKAKDIPGVQIKYTALKNVWEIINGKKVILEQNNPGSWFLAFDSLNEGMGHHLNFLKNTRYKKAWVSVENGDCSLFAHLLKVSGYYTAPESDYIKLINIYFNQYMKDLSFEKYCAKLNSLDTENKAKNLFFTNVFDKIKSFF